jgi:hypothetical protein
MFRFLLLPGYQLSGQGKKFREKPAKVVTTEGLEWKIL